ncbi:MAG: response regulator transcription factor [Psychromonas sp.]
MEIRLILIVENRIYREGIGHFLNQVQDFDMLSAHCSFAMAKQSLGTCNADIVIIDSHLPDALGMQHTFKYEQTGLKVVMLTNGNNTGLITHCMQAGVEGVLNNNDSMQDLKQCILSVYSGHLCYPANSYSILQQSSSAEKNVFPLDHKAETTLTTRQLKVMRLVEQGYSNKEIARKLNIELCTVKNHVHHILDKLRVKNRCEAASLFRRCLGQQA